MKIKLRIKKNEHVDIDELHALQGKAKTLSDGNFEKLKRTILTDGFLFTIHVWENNGVINIIDGHQRVHVLRQLRKEGHEIPKIDCAFVDAEDLLEAKKMVMLAISQFGKLNKDGFFDFIGDDEFDFQDFDFPDIDQDFFKEIEDGQFSEEDDNVPDIPENENPYGVAKGDLWRLGDHMVMCGDSTSKKAVETLLGDDRIDLLVTDPPYNVAYESGDHMAIENDDMSDADFAQFLFDVYSAADAALKPGACFYIWHADSEGYNFRKAAHDVGWKLRQTIIWKKSQIVMGRQDYQWIHEPCLYGWKAGAGHKWRNNRKQTTVLEYEKPRVNDLHPTMKPVELIAYQINNNSDKGDNVMDLFLGSGTTLIASEKLGRRCYGMEFETHYINVIIRRWEEHNGGTAIRVGNYAADLGL